tara:strand:+ start:2460 stop:3086 length:627 start_codon:yes stop_codon:yes gene_type:complete
MNFQSFITEGKDYRGKVLDHYKPFSEDYDADDPRCVSWMDGKDNQWKRFAELFKIGTSEGDVILDWGCGTGGLVEFIKEHTLPIKYVGVDINEEYIAMARRRFPERLFLDGDIDQIQGESVDWVFASGIFNVGYTIEEMVKVIGNAIPCARKGVAFNLLKDSQGFVEGFNPQIVIGELFNQYQVDSIISENYTDDFNDYTVYIRKHHS